tara:strand:- start:804 stop:1676 length:873 start_codon:yes stop_codon:yes gene_type:complete
LATGKGERMTVIVVAGEKTGSGASTVAVGISLVAAQRGLDVSIRRLGSDDSATQDAFGFAQVLSSQIDSGEGLPLEMSALPALGNQVNVVEVDASQISASAESVPTSKIVWVNEGVTNEAAFWNLTNRSKSSGDRSIIEDRVLAAPTVAELIEAANASLLSSPRTGNSALCEHVLIGAISHDSADDYFGRYSSKAVISRAEKVDLGLAALLSNAECLLLTGGHEPSPYLLDRASASATTVALSPNSTTVTAKDIEGIFGISGFNHPEKADRILELLLENVPDSDWDELFS